jgi:hypothetical protein
MRLRRTTINENGDRFTLMPEQGGAKLLTIFIPHAE